MKKNELFRRSEHSLPLVSGLLHDGGLPDAEKAGTQLTHALIDHSDGALAVFTAISQGNLTDALVAAWRKNGREVAHVYNDYMPGLTPSVTEQMMDTQITALFNEAIAIFVGNQISISETFIATFLHQRLLSDYLNGSPL